MTRRMTEADWLAVARVFHAIHQRQADAGAASTPAGDDPREVAMRNARVRRETADLSGDDRHDPA